MEAFAFQCPGPGCRRKYPLPGSAIPQFVDPLPELGEMGAIVAGNGSEIALEMREFQAETLPTGTFAPGVKPKTWVWGYLPQGQTSRTTHLGPDHGRHARPAHPDAVHQQSRRHRWQQCAGVEKFHGPDTGLGRPAERRTERLRRSGDAQPAGHTAHGRLRPELLRVQSPLACTSTAAKCRPGWTAVLMPGTPAMALTRAMRFTRIPASAAAGNEAVYRYPNTQESAPVWFHDQHWVPRA